MAATKPNTIILKLNGGNTDARPVDDSYTPASAITPGEVIEFATATTMQAQSTAGDADAMMVALEDPYIRRGHTTDDTIDHDWATTQKVRWAYLQPGDVFYGFLAAGESVTRGAPLEFDGAGGFQAETTGTVVAYAEETKDNSGGGASVRIRVRVR